jgi:hypothetical protein
VQQFHRPQFQIFGQRLHEHVAVRYCLRRPANLSSGALDRVIDLRDGISAAIRRAVFSETPLSAAISLHVCSARRRTWISCRLSMSIILSLVGGQLSDDLTR